MPRSDPRTERGLAVARRMQNLTRRDGVAEALKKAQEALSPRKPAQESPEARMQRGRSMLAALGRRMGEDELRSLDHVHGMYGLPGVIQALANAGVPAEALEAVQSISQGGGLPAVVHAVREQIQAEDAAQITAAASPDAAAVLSSLSDADMAEAVRIYNAGGPEALAARAAQLGVDPIVAQVAIRSLEAYGVDGARQVAAEHMQHQERAADIEQATERAIAQGQKAARDPLASLMADRNFQQIAGAFYGDKAAKLEAAGLGLRRNESPAEWMIRMRDQSPAKFAEVTGEPLSDIRALLGEAAGVSDRSEVVSRVAHSDAARRKGRVVPIAPDRKAVETKPRKPDGVEAALEKAKRALGADRDDGPVRAESMLEAKLHLSEGVPLERLTFSSTAKAQIQRRAERRTQAKADHAKSFDGRIEQAAEHLERRAAEAPPEPEREGRSGGMSIEDAIRAADAALGGTNNE